MRRGPVQGRSPLRSLGCLPSRPGWLTIPPMADKVAPDGSTRERVKALQAQGLSTRQIAAALNISTQAVHYHIGKLREAS